MSTPEPGPATRRRQLGRQLRDLRIAAGFKTMDAAAEASGLSRATISRIESAKQTILPRTVRLLCQTYGIGAPMLDHLVRLAEESEDRGWLVAYSDTTPDWLERYVGEEAEASEIWTYQAEYIPGLLQTAEYCRAVARATAPSPKPDAVSRVVELRLARQRRVDAEQVKHYAVINEAAIRRRVGPQGVMAAQLHHLIDMAAKPNITMQVLPFEAGEHPAMVGSFSILTFPGENAQPTIYVEMDSGAVYPDRPTDVMRYSWIRSRLSELALPHEKSIDLIRTLVPQHETGQER